MNRFFHVVTTVLLPLLALAASEYGKGIHVEQQIGAPVSVASGGELHIRSVDAPISGNGSVDLRASDAWLVFEGVKASQVKAKWLSKVTVEGRAAQHPYNVRLAQWGSGCVVIPYGYGSDRNPLALYSEPDCKGQSMECEINRFYRGLGALDNNVRSFRLKRGYMATLANNPDGTGHSRVWIAADSDIVVNVMPDGFVTYRGANGTFDAANSESFVSFARVFRWEWTGKKGWGGGSVEEMVLANIDAYYRWSADKIYDSPELAAKGFYEYDHEFSPIKQQYWWPGWADIDTLQNVTHLCGYNEPNLGEQANATVDAAIEQWPYMFTSGLRLGSPAPSGVFTSWSDDFWTAIKRYNYRCDLNVTHIYEYIDGNAWRERIAHMVEESGGRPCWVTEYNNGAGWTGEQWPDQEGPRVDIHGAYIDADGNPTDTPVNVARPATAANMEHQRRWMEQILPALDGIDKLERTHVFNWVEDARNVILNGELTPAGEIFAKHVSVPGYKASQAYEHVWNIAPPAVFADFTDNNTNVHIKFYDHNGETGQRYVFSVLKAGGWVAVDSLMLGDDYQPGERVEYDMPFPDDARANQVMAHAVAYDGRKSLAVNFKIDLEPIGAPRFKGHAFGDSILLTWEPVDRAVEYRILVGPKKDKLHYLAKTSDTRYMHHTTPETVYYYRVEAFDRFGASNGSTLRVYSGTAGLGSPVVDGMTITSVAGGIAIESRVACELSIYRPDGRLARTVQVAEGTTVVDGMQRGVYIANRQKVIVY